MTDARFNGFCMSCYLAMDLRTNAGVCIYCGGDLLPRGHTGSPLTGPPPSRKRPSIGKRNNKLRRVVERDGDGCHLCGMPVNLGLDPRYESGGPTLDHVVPVSKGGVGSVTNLKLAHKSCNNQRGSEPLGVVEDTG